MRVFVRWYGKVLEGEMLDGDLMGMKQVRIPLDGHHPIALFTPGHVYQNADHPDLITFDTKSVKKETFAINTSTPSDVLSACVRKNVEVFKAQNWDHEHNHLRIDKLDEFYQLWKEIIAEERGFRDYKDSKEISQQKLACQIISKKASRPMGKQQFINATQLSLFE